jgi:VanZ family protein
LLTKDDPKTKKYIYGALLFYWIILLSATSFPTESLPDLGGSDKIKHFGAYMVLTVLLTLTLMVQDKNTFLKKYAFPASVIIAALYGILDEVHQMFIPGRSCEFMDWVADLGGAITGSLMVYIYFRVYQRFSREKG